MIARIALGNAIARKNLSLSRLRDTFWPRIISKFLERAPALAINRELFHVSGALISRTIITIGDMKRFTARHNIVMHLV